MQHIEEILSKHFAGEANPQEEAAVAQWKTENGEEYDILSKAWAASADLEIREYDAKSALAKIESQLREQPTETKVFKLNSVFRYAVAACAVVLIGLTAVWFKGRPDFVTVENNTAVAMEVDMLDGSKVTLAPNSTLEYNKDFKNHRDIRLDGEAYFDVARDEAHPFIIETEFGNVEVLGTAFNVDVNEGNTHVFVERGKVSLRYEGDEVQLTKGQEGFSTGEMVSKAEEATDPNIMSWRTGYFVFENTPLSTVVEELDGYYEEKITLENKKAGEIAFTGQFRKRPVEELIEIIVLTCRVEAEYGENTIRLK